MAMIWKALTFGCVVLALSVLGLVVFLSVTGCLTPENLQVLNKILVGEKVYTEAAEEEPEPIIQPLSAEESLAMSEQAVTRTNLLTNRHLAEIDYKQKQLENLQKQVEQEKKQLESIRQQIADERTKLAEEIRAGDNTFTKENFDRELKLYEQMAPKQVRDIFMDMPEPLAARFMAAMKPQILADLMANFKTEQEKAKAQKLLALMRTIQS